MKFPECPDKREDCRFITGGTICTDMAWFPEYDKNGQLLNSNPNSESTEITCTVCGRKWWHVRQHGLESLELK